MDQFRQRFTRIHDGFSTARRIPRRGIIRLGIKKVSQRTGKEYPVETPYFVCPPEVQARYGPEPTELPIMIPTENLDVIFPQKLARFGSSRGKVCEGNMREAREKTASGQWQDRACPCEHLRIDQPLLLPDGRTLPANPKGECTRMGSLSFFIPDVSLGGVYQITTRSFNSAQDLNSGLEFVKDVLGRIAMVPLILRRVPTETHHNDQKQIHYPLTLQLPDGITPRDVAELRADKDRVLMVTQHVVVEPPEETNPELDAPDYEVEDDDRMGGAEPTTATPGEAPAPPFAQGSAPPANVPQAAPDARIEGPPGSHEEYIPEDPSKMTWTEFRDWMEEDPERQCVLDFAKAKVVPGLKDLRNIPPRLQEAIMNTCQDALAGQHNERTRRRMGMKGVGT